MRVREPGWSLVIEVGRCPPLQRGGIGVRQVEPGPSSVVQLSRRCGDCLALCRHLEISDASSKRRGGVGLPRFCAIGGASAPAAARHGGLVPPSAWAGPPWRPFSDPERWAEDRLSRGLLMEQTLLDFLSPNVCEQAGSFHHPVRKARILGNPRANWPRRPGWRTNPTPQNRRVAQGCRDFRGRGQVMK